MKTASVHSARLSLPDGMAQCDHQLLMTRDQEVWGMALWVDRQHGTNGWFHIATQQDRLLACGDLDGVALWKVIAERWEQIQKAKAQPQ